MADLAEDCKIRVQKHLVQLLCATAGPFCKGLDVMRPLAPPALGRGEPHGGPGPGRGPILVSKAHVPTK